MKRYDDDYTGDLERALYGRRVTLPRRRTPGQMLDAELGQDLRYVGAWLMFRTMPEEFAGSRLATIGRLIVLAAVASAVVLTVLAIVGVVPWNS